MFLDTKTDEELMVLYQNGTESAFQLLYQRHASKILGFIKSRLRNPERAHDVFQEVFLKIHKSKHLYNRTLPVLPWIFTITKNALIDEIRKAEVDRNQVEIDESSLSVSDMAPAIAFSEISPLMAGLPRSQKTAVEMRYYEEKTFDEIAKVLGTSSMNVRQLVTRGVRHLRELIHKGEKS